MNTWLRLRDTNYEIIPSFKTLAGVGGYYFDALKVLDNGCSVLYRALRKLRLLGGVLDLDV
jgi:hypothetical protein